MALKYQQRLYQRHLQLANAATEIVLCLFHGTISARLTPIFYTFNKSFVHNKMGTCGVCKSKAMSVTNLELFVFLYCCRSAHSALHKRNTQPILMQFKITVLPQQLNSKILQTQLHNGTRKAKLYKEKT